MEYRSQASVICALMMLFSLNTQAQTTAQVSAGIANYNLELTQGDSSIDDAVPYGKIALSQGISNQMAISAYYVVWGEGSSSFTEQSTRPGLGSVFADRTFDFDRSEYSVSLSFGLPLANAGLNEDSLTDPGSLSLVTGYRWSETTANSSTIGTTTGFDFNQQFSMNVEANGPYIALKYYSPELPQLLSGRVGINVGIGLMKFEATSFAEGIENGTPFTIEGTSEDTFLGSLVGLSWSAGTPGFGYGLSLEYFNYEYDVLSEKSLALTASVSTAF